MNSRERVNEALNHKEPDKIPLDLGGNQSGIHIKAYKNLLDYLEIEDNEIQYYDFVQQLVDPCEQLLKRFQIDVRYIRPLGGMVKIDDVEPQYEGKYVGVYDQFGVFWGNDAEKDIEDILYYDPVIHPLADCKTVEDIENYDWPDGKDKTPFKGLREYAKNLYDNTDYALSTPPTGCIYEYTTFLFGFTKVLRYFRTKPELLVSAMNHLLDYWINYNESFLSEVGQYLDVVCINGDLAEQAGPIMNLKLYEEMIKPIERKLSEKVHKLADVKINYHCCGSIPQFIPHFSEISYDAVNPVQISAYDMAPCGLKERFGEQISFWGGLCNTQDTLPFGTPEQIRKEVKHNMWCFKENGGYIAANIHNITAEVPPENIVAMFGAANEFRNY
ncbi:MAG: Methylcobalamin:coenzyme M methyltransferase [Promethearchaeota archaeon]|nr:MAG: Methylcobalamin:coenzyme M methyltransferase [Candidatus Lokiarchaeota archaeon]